MPGPHQQVREPAPERRPELGAPQVEDEARQALEELDHDVAEHRVADDHVGHLPGQVLALDVADEVEVGLVDELGRALDPGLALALLLPDREQRDARAVHAQHALGEDRAHARVLREVLRGRVGVGADVEQHERPAAGRDLDREAGPVDALQAAEAEDGGRHAGAGVARGHDRVGLALPDEVRGDEDRRVLLLAQGHRRVLVHADDLGRVDDADVRGARRREALDRGGVADEDDGVVGMRVRVGDGARHDLGRAVVAAHRVDRDPHAGPRDSVGRGGRQRPRRRACRIVVVAHEGVTRTPRPPSCRRPA